MANLGSLYSSAVSGASKIGQGLVGTTFPVLNGLNQLRNAAGIHPLASVYGNLADPTVNVLGQPNATSGDLTLNDPPTSAPAPVANQPYSEISGTAGGGTPQDQAYWAQQQGAIGDSLSRLGNQANIGQGNILSGYNAAFDQLTNQQGQAQRNYDTTRTQTEKSNVLAKNSIDGGVRNQLTSIQRLLGSHGAGNSSTAQIAAPYAVGRVGNTQRNQVQDAYTQNINALDTGWGDTKNQFLNAFGSLTADRTNREHSLQQSIDQNRAELLPKQQQIASYLGKAADPAVAAQIQALNGQVDQLGAQQTFNPGQIDYKTPTLAGYNYTSAGAPQLGTGIPASAGSNLGAYWSLLNGQKDKKSLVGV